MLQELTYHKIAIKTGLAAQLTQAEHDYGVKGELLYITDTDELRVHDGTEYVLIGVNKFITHDGTGITNIRMSSTPGGVLYDVALDDSGNVTRTPV